MRISIPLQAADDYIDSIGENEIQLDANTIDGGTIWQPEPVGEQEFYPDLEIDYDGEDAPACIVNGMPVQSVEIVGGVHTPQRPK